MVIRTSNLTIWWLPSFYVRSTRRHENHSNFLGVFHDPQEKVLQTNLPPKFNPDKHELYNCNSSEKHPCLFWDFSSAGVFFLKYRSAPGGKRNENNFNWQEGVHIHIVSFFCLVYKTCHIRKFFNISSLLQQVIARVAPSYPLVKKPSQSPDQQNVWIVPLNSI